MKRDLTKDEAQGMTVNERLYHAGLFEEFDSAVGERDALKLRSIFEKIHISTPDIERTFSLVSGIIRPVGFDPDGFVPRDKHDHESVNRAIAAGFPSVEPVLGHLLEWIQDYNWPVAKTLAPFLASIGKPLVPHIKRVFESDDEMWKYTIMNEIFLHSPEIAEEFRDELDRIAYEPNEKEVLEEIVDDAMWVLEHYGWERQSLPGG